MWENVQIGFKKKEYSCLQHLDHRFKSGCRLERKALILLSFSVSRLSSFLDQNAVFFPKIPPFSVGKNVQSMYGDHFGNFKSMYGKNLVTRINTGLSYYRDAKEKHCILNVMLFLLPYILFFIPSIIFVSNPG